MIGILLLRLLGQSGHSGQLAFWVRQFRIPVSSHDETFLSP